MLLHAAGKGWLGTNPAAGVARANEAIANEAMAAVVDVNCIVLDNRVVMKSGCVT